MEGLDAYYEEERPWGNFERFTLNEQTTVKILTVEPAQAFSLQRHGHRGEFWRVLSGTGFVEIDGVRKEARSGDSFFLKQGAIHRATAESEPLVMLEISFGQFDEADITRLKDNYGRA